MDKRQENIYMAKLAEQAERYDGKFMFSFIAVSLIIERSTNRA